MNDAITRFKRGIEIRVYRTSSDPDINPRFILSCGIDDLDNLEQRIHLNHGPGSYWIRMMDIIGPNEIKFTLTDEGL